jgi:hypothetical protein
MTPGAKRALMALSGEWHDAYALCRQRKTRMSLTNGGWTEPYRMGPVTCFWKIRLTPAGLALQAELRENTDG